MQAVVVDAVEVGDLVHECRVHLVAELVLVLARVQVRLAVHDDPVGQLPAAVAPALREGPAVVEAEQVEAAVFGAVLDDEDDVVETLDHVVGQLIQLLDDEGYAILRTPWPFLEPVEKPQGFRRAEHIDEDTAVEEDLEDAQTDGWTESGPAGALEVGDASSAEGATALPPAGSRHIALEIPGAIGPETHVYGSSGVHLYMKQRTTPGG